MRVRLLSPYGQNLAKAIWEAGDDVLYQSDEGYAEVCVMYGHREILRAEEIAQYRGVINIHPSMLPYGRGAHPNFWAWHDGEPHGVTMHYVVDEGVDTGPIIATAAVEFAMPERETLNSSYMELHEAAERLFALKWPEVRNGAPSYPQIGQGSLHRKKDLEPLWPLLSKGWDSPVTEVIELGRRSRGLASNAMDAVGSGRVASA